MNYHIFPRSALKFFFFVISTHFHELLDFSSFLHGASMSFASPNRLSGISGHFQHKKPTSYLIQKYQKYRKYKNTQKIYLVMRFRHFLKNYFSEIQLKFNKTTFPPEQ